MSDELSYYPFERLAIRFEPTNMIIEGLYWLTSHWGVFHRVEGVWEEYFSEADTLETVMNHKYMHVRMSDFEEITKQFDYWKSIEQTLDEPLDYDYCEEFQYVYPFEDIVPIAEGYPPLREFYEIYRWSRKFIDGYHDGLENPLVSGGRIRAAERPLYRDDMLELQGLRIDYEAEISRRLNLDFESKTKLKLGKFAVHPIISQHVKSLESQAYSQYQLECFRLGTDDDWGMFYPTIKYLDFLKGEYDISYVELSEISSYFEEVLLRSAQAKNNYEPHSDPRPVSDWYKEIMK
jgi:hypothetical protein